MSKAGNIPNRGDGAPNSPFHNEFDATLSSHYSTKAGLFAGVRAEPCAGGGMRYRELFSVFPRRLKSWRRVYYYQTYDEEGKRTAGRSTGAVRARDARMYCMKLYRAGMLGVTEKRTPTMAKFSDGWWDMTTCECVKSRMTRRKISTSYVRIAH